MIKQAEDDSRNITLSHNESAIQMEVVAIAYQHQQQMQQQSQRNIQSTQTRPCSNAERQRRYREKIKADKMNACTSFNQSSNVQPQQEQPQHDVQINKRQPQSNAERQRKYRKLLREQQQQQQQMDDTNAITVLSNTPHTSSIHQLRTVDQFERARKLYLNKQRQSRFRARQRFKSPSTSSHQAQEERNIDMNLDTIDLINEIMIRPEIWMSKHPGNKNKWKTMRKWEDMKNDKFPQCTVDDLKKRWKNIKDQYRKELKKLPQARPGVPLENISSNWKYFEYMSFLKDELIIFKDQVETETPDVDSEIGLGECSSGASQDYRMIEVSEIKRDPTESHSDHKSDDENDTPIANPVVRLRNNPPPKEMREELLKIEQRKLQILEAEIARSAAYQKSDNYQFLMSILPEMEKLPSIHKMRLRMKISQAVLDEVSMYEQERFNNIELGHMQDGNCNVSIEIKEEPINMYD